MSSPNNEIPPPPRTPRVDLAAGRWRASFPSAVIVALITTMGTVAAQYATSAKDVAEIKSRLDRIEAQLEQRLAGR